MRHNEAQSMGFGIYYGASLLNIKILPNLIENSPGEILAK